MAGVFVPGPSGFRVDIMGMWRWEVGVAVALGGYAVYRLGEKALGYEPVKAKDAVWTLEEENNPMVIVACGVYEKISSGEMKKVLERKAFYGEKRARQYVKRVLGKAYWVEDAQFRFEEHFHVVTEEVGSKEELCALASDLASRAFPANRPPWDFYFLPSYLSHYSVVIYKIHHVLMDGLSAISAITHCSDSIPAQIFHQLPKKSYFSRLFDTIKAVFMLPYWIWAWGELQDDENPLHGQELSGQKSIYWTNPLNLKEIKQFCKEKMITLNDFLAAASLRTLKKCANAKNSGNYVNFSLFLPISLRKLPENGEKLPMDNDFASLLVPMPPADSPTLEQDCSRLFSLIKQSTQPLSLALMVSLLGLLPPKIASKMLFSVSNRGSFVFSNVPGPLHPLYFSSSRLVNLIAVAPCSGTCGISITTVTYMDTLNIACYVDKALLSQAKVVCEWIREDIEISLRLETYYGLPTVQLTQSSSQLLGNSFQLSPNSLHIPHSRFHPFQRFTVSV